MSRLHRALFGGLVAGILGFSGAANAAPGGFAPGDLAARTPATLVGHGGGGGGSFVEAVAVVRRRWWLPWRRR